MKVTVVGAGKYGSTTVQRLAEADVADEVCMLDVVKGLPQGLALDLNQSRPITGHRSQVVGTNHYGDTADSDVVVVTAGKPRGPGMGRDDLLRDNAEIVGGVAREVAATSPEAVVLVVSNPLDEMTALFQRVSGFDRSRVMGQAGMLDTARFREKLATAAGVSSDRVDAMTLGSHGDTMVPVSSRVTVDGKPLGEVLSASVVDEVCEATRRGGAEVVALLETGSAYYAPSAAAARMVRAVLTDEGAVMPTCAWVSGEYGISDVYLGVPARLGRGGVQEVTELAISDAERAALQTAAETVRSKQGDVEQFVPA